MKVVQQRAIKNEIKTLVRNTKQQNRLALRNIFRATLCMLCKNHSLRGIQYIYFVLHISGVNLGTYQHSRQAIKNLLSDLPIVVKYLCDTCDTLWEYDSLEKVVSIFDIVSVKRKLSMEESLKLNWIKKDNDYLIADAGKVRSRTVVMFGVLIRLLMLLSC